MTGGGLGSLIQIYNNGTQIGTFGTYVAGDTFGIYFDGESTVYIHNGIPFYVLPVAVTSGAFNPMFCMFAPDVSTITNVAIWIGV